MKSYTVYDSVTKAVLRSGMVQDAGLTQQLAPYSGNGFGVLLDVCGLIGQRINATGDGVEDIPPPVLSLSELKSAAKAAAAQRRWEVETQGIIFGGSKISTDDRSKLLLSAAAAQARLDASFTATWKTEDGTWVTLDARTILAVYAAVFNWISSCFSREHELGGLVDGAADVGAVVALAPNIQKFWP